MKRPNSRTSTAGERDRPKRPDTVTCTESSTFRGKTTVHYPREIAHWGVPRAVAAPQFTSVQMRGGGLIPGVRDPVYSPQSCEGVLFCTGAGQDTPREPQTLFVHLSSHEEGLNRSGPEPAPLFTSARMRGAVYSGVQKSLLFTSVV